MPTPEPFNDVEREYYATFKAMVREHMPDGAKLVGDLRNAYEQFWKEENIILSRRERYRLFLLILEEVLAEMEEARGRLEV